MIAVLALGEKLVDKIPRFIFRDGFEINDELSGGAFLGLEKESNLGRHTRPDLGSSCQEFQGHWVGGGACRRKTYFGDHRFIGLIG